MYSLVIRGGIVIDGTGGAPFRADVAVVDGKIAAIGQELSGAAAEVVDATGLAVCPGFIDIHSHTDGSIFRNPLADSKVLQGVTTEVTGNCGIGLFPVAPGERELLTEYLTMHDFSLPPDGIAWQDFREYAEYVEAGGIGVNLAPLASHGALRLAVMGAVDRDPDIAQQQTMENTLDEAMEQGAWGLSAGLIYAPGSYSGSEELVGLARVVARHGGLFAAHIRNESDGLLEALEEMIAIGVTGGARMQISHLKAIGRANWGKAKAALNVLEAARRRGLDISADQYPYEATSTSLTALVPQWAMSGGVEALLARLEQPDTRKAIKREISREMLLRGGSENIVIAGAAPGYALDETGKTLADVAAVRRCRPDEAVIRLLLKTRATVAAVYFSLSSGDVAGIAASPDVAVGSDGQGLSVATDGGTMTHPRSYGTFPRVLAKFVREDGLLSWETAVNKMSGLPASRLGFTDRGILRQGMAADIVVFDQHTVADGGDFANPHRYPVGIEYVFIAGTAVARGGRLTGARPGRVLRRGF